MPLSIYASSFRNLRASITSWSACTLRKCHIRSVKKCPTIFVRLVLDPLSEKPYRCVKIDTQVPRHTDNGNLTTVYAPPHQVLQHSTTCCYLPWILPDWRPKERWRYHGHQTLEHLSTLNARSRHEHLSIDRALQLARRHDLVCCLPICPKAR